jgi:hypothetical protein
MNIFHFDRVNSVVRKTGCFDFAGPFWILTRRMQIEDSRAAVVSQDGVAVAVFGICADEKIIIHCRFEAAPKVGVRMGLEA